jgi:lysophospholipase L1-like esterase
MQSGNSFLEILFRRFQVTIPEVKLRISPWFIVLLFIGAYIAWEGYWYSKVGLPFIKWHTHLAVYVIIWMLGAVFFKVLQIWFNDKRIADFFLSFTALVFTLFVVEIVLIFTGTTKTYLEKMHGQYYSQYVPQDTSYYHAWRPNVEHWIRKPEFTYWRPTNSLGLGDEEWTVAVDKGHKRIMALGDSFTEGDGAPYDSSYVAILKTMFSASGDSAYWMNAGVMGSDPFFNYIMLKDKLLKYKPDVVIQTLSTQDLLDDIALRGGMERFRADGKLQFKPAPWWEPVYAVNYVIRLFFSAAGYNSILQKNEFSDVQIQQFDSMVIALFDNYAKLCSDNGIKLFVILRPDKSDLTKDAYCYDFTTILRSLRSDSRLTVIDLLPLYKTYFATHNTTADTYFWPLDGHHNSKGYHLMATTMYTALAPLLADSSVTKR